MKKPSVFVVDDEVQIGSLLTRMLQREGYAVRAFASGEEALSALPADPPEVIITDLLMPGMSGLDLIRRVRETAPAVAAVLTTGFASTDDLIEALRAGAADFVSKPFDLAQIRAVVARVLERGRSGARPSGERTGELDLASANLAKRLRDLSVVESVHALLAGEPATSDLVPRMMSSLSAALDVADAALWLPGDGAQRWRVSSSAPARPAAETPRETDATELSRVSEGRTAVRFDRAAGPSAAAPVRSRDAAVAEGVLVVSRAAGAAAFSDDDLRALLVFATSLADVLRAVRFAERGEASYVDSLRDIVAATEARCPWFARHSERVRDFSLALGTRLGLPLHDLEVLETAACLLDLGRLDTPDELLSRPGRPNDDEWRLIRRHTLRSDELVRPVGRLKDVKPVLRHHHENWDGSGYPSGLAGDDIPYLAALVRITDSYAALTAPRAWRPAMTPRDAMRELVGLSGRHFHPRFVAAFTEIELERPL